MPMVEIHQFSYTYPGKVEPVLHNINLTIGAGAFVVITGESGSGKSTLGKAIAGFIFQDEAPNYSGEIIVNGTDMSLLPLFDASKRVTYVQQNPEDQFCTLTVRDEIAFGLENQCMAPEIIEERIDAVLDIVKGPELKYRELAILSGGEKQKIAIASMLALSPDVIILDEPTSNLDPTATKQIFETLQQIRHTQDLTVIIIEHKLSQLYGLRPLIYILDQGQINPFNEKNRQNLFYSKETETIKFPVSEMNSVKSDRLVELSGVNVSLSGKHILHNIDLTFERGEFVALMGPNGSGKSTLLETILGFHPIDSGHGKILKHELEKIKTSELVKDTGYIFQNPDHQLFTQSVWDEAILTSKNLGLAKHETKALAENWLKTLKLDDRAGDHPQRLSYGQKRQLNLAAAMLHGPQLLLIDELLIGQDMGNAHTWMSLLNNYVQYGHTVCLVIHHAELTSKYCDRIVFMKQGEIVVDESTDKAFQALERHGFSTFCPENSLDTAYA